MCDLRDAMLIFFFEFYGIRGYALVSCAEQRRGHTFKKVPFSIECGIPVMDVPTDWFGPKVGDCTTLMICTTVHYCIGYSVFSSSSWITTRATPMYPTYPTETNNCTGRTPKIKNFNIITTIVHCCSYHCSLNYKTPCNNFRSRLN